MQQSFLEIEVAAIRPNLRLIYRWESIELLCRSIQSEGLREPIQIWFDGEGFRIWDGELRWRACKTLGLNRVKAHLFEF